MFCVTAASHGRGCLDQESYSFFCHAWKARYTICGTLQQAGASSPSLQRPTQNEFGHNLACLCLPYIFDIQNLFWGVAEPFDHKISSTFSSCGLRPLGICKPHPPQGLKVQRLDCPRAWLSASAPGCPLVGRCPVELHVSGSVPPRDAPDKGRCGGRTARCPR